jgi:anhydro-N-acetylmuramic acid kinase
MQNRYLIGLSIGSGREGVDATLIRMSGSGFAAVPSVEKYTRVPFLGSLRENLRQGNANSREVGEMLSSAVRQLIAKSGLDLRLVQLIGLHAPSTLDSLCDYVAEQTGVTVWSRFAARDVAAGGAGWPFTAMSDFLFAKLQIEDLLLIHLGHSASILYLPSQAKIPDLIGFDAGPCGQLLDDIIRLGSREKEWVDAGGTKAVQGKCIEELLAEWLTHPHLSRKPPKPLGSAEFRSAFVTRAFNSAKEHNATLADLLCTATHFIARCVGIGCVQFLPKTDRPRRIAISGGGVRNGFLWQRLQQQFPDEELHRTDEIGIPALGRNAVAAAVLAGITLDGVAVNLPLLTGASGGRLVGRFTPGDPRNWATVSAWAAEQLWDYLQITKAA